jgi:cell division protein FtsN
VSFEKKSMPKKNKKVSLSKKPFLVLSRRAIAGWLVAIFFVSAWMFGIGVWVGRGTSPLKIDISELQKKLQIARNQIKKKEREQIPPKSDPAKAKPELEFYESLKKNGDDDQIPPVPSPPIIEKRIDPAPPKTPAKPKKESKKRLTKTQQKATEIVAPSDKGAVEKSKPQPAPPESKIQPAAKPYTIQVAAFKAAGDADKLVAELKQKGFFAYRAIGKIPGKGIWYRVRVGEFNTKAEAGSTIVKLKKAGKKPIIVDK